jgi:hypothetical protein
MRSPLLAIGTLAVVVATPGGARGTPNLTGTWNHVKSICIRVNQDGSVEKVKLIEGQNVSTAPLRIQHFANGEVNAEIGVFTLEGGVIGRGDQQKNKMKGILTECRLSPDPLDIVDGFAYRVKSAKVLPANKKGETGRMVLERDWYRDQFASKYHEVCSGAWVRVSDAPLLVADRPQ